MLRRAHRSTRTTGRIAGLAIALLTATAVASVAAAPAQSAPERTVAAATADPIDYVALGDSYSAGPLIPSTRPDPIGCVRSTNNYPAYLAGFLQVATYRDVTCSGARTGDFFHRQTVPLGTSPAAQLTALSADTDLVTVGIGGNDFALFGSMIGTCQQVAAQDPTGTPCRDAFTNASGVDTKLRDARRVQKTVAAALKAVHRHAPNAKVYVVGYPRLLPLTGTCAAVPFAAGDYAWARRVEWLLNKSLRTAAGHHSAHYVDLYPATKDHDACATDPWINGHEFLPGVAANFHPFKIGEREMGRAVFHQMTGRFAPRPADAAPPAGSIVPNPPVAP